jgi:hypothetical protein
MAWFLLVFLYGWAIVMWMFESDRFATRWVLGLAYDLVTFALLVSPPIRDRLRKPVSIRRRREHLSLG